ncbi:hypothetical protein QAD02_021403 [Eretmocerus hayati]|uniref:Uncharacterized protein n=1 Tax=Eretmocerus hayati TaxID=131215 RepID=A0ACC2PQC2_9HYME|nr:hypothetical protein QAD02_021403 [Eretmocerus hayati]
MEVVEEIDNFLEEGDARMDIDGNGHPHDAAAARNAGIHLPNRADPAHQGVHHIPPPPARGGAVMAEAAGVAQGHQEDVRALHPPMEQEARGAALHAPVIAPEVDAGNAIARPPRDQVAAPVNNGNFRVRGVRAGYLVQERRRVMNILRVLDNMGQMTYGRIHHRRQRQRNIHQGGRGGHQGARGANRGHQDRNHQGGQQGYHQVGHLNQY